MNKILLAIFVIFVNFINAQTPFVSEYTIFEKKGVSSIYIDESVDFKLYEFSIVCDTIKVDLSFVRSTENINKSAVYVFSNIYGSNYIIYYYDRDITKIVYESYQYRITYCKKIYRL
jgi:hypothetical protein